MSLETEIISITLSDNTTIKAVTTTLDTPGKPKLVASNDSKFNIANISETITTLAEDLGEVFKKSKATKASIEFGIVIGVESGNFTALLVKGTSTANLKVSLEWEIEKKL